MKLLDVLTAPWAIQPAKLLEIQAIYATHLRGEKIDIAAVEQRLGRPLDNQAKAYDVIDGVAIIPMEGVLAKRANLFMQISGGTSTQLLERDLRAALADNAVHSIILSIDSPGGSVDGTMTLANAISQGKATKPIVTLASGVMASAAYWIGSAADAAYIADGTTQVGSIGVVATHTDISRQQEAAGIKTTEIFAGKYKRIASNYQPLTDAGRATMQEQVDYYYSLFVAAVAQHRGVSEEQVLKDMADGRVFIGQQAIAAGLVDGVSTLDALVVQLNQDRSRGSRSLRAGAAAQLPQPKETTMPITREQLAAEAPDVLAAILAEGQAAGASAERARIQAVEEQLLPGHEALIKTMKFDGKSTAGDAAMAITAAERALRTSRAGALSAEAPTPLPLAPVASVTTGAAAGDVPSRADLDAKARAYMADHPGTEYVAAYKAVGGK